PSFAFCSRQNSSLWNVHVARDLPQTDPARVRGANLHPCRFRNTFHRLIIKRIRVPIRELPLCNRQASRQSLRRLTQSSFAQRESAPTFIGVRHPHAWRGG